MACLMAEGGQVDNVYDWNEDYELNRKRNGLPQADHQMIIQDKNLNKLG